MSRSETAFREADGVSLVQPGAALPVSSSAVETIVAAAIRVPVATKWTERVYRGKKMYPEYIIVTAPPPARHGTLLHPLYDWDMLPASIDDQGFVTSTGRFVERKEALRIALASGQPMIDHPSRHSTLLFSEDLW